METRVASLLYDVLVSRLGKQLRGKSMTNSKHSQTFTLCNVVLVTGNRTFQKLSWFSDDPVNLILRRFPRRFSMLC